MRESGSFHPMDEKCSDIIIALDSGIARRTKLHVLHRFSPRMRFNDHLSFTVSATLEKELNNYGWVATSFDSLQNPTILFGRRDITTVNNILTATYIFNTKASLSLRARHYWSQANYLSFYSLNTDGDLDPASFIDNQNINFNAFSVDLQFIWYFAPGSEMSVVWKNLINTWGDQLEHNYFTDLSNTLNAPQTNSFSVRILYYIDYLNN